ncbi:slightly ste11-like protein [Friedmanniomyces endolithicus]|nr:slightly ste11-like protein [Friedmanniomyces endolithicus]
MSATQHSLLSLPQTWEHTIGQAQRPDDTGRIIFTRQLWRRNMPDGNNIEHGVLNKSQSQDAHQGQHTSAPPSRRVSLNVTTRSRRRSPSPSRESKTPLTPEESPPFTTSRKRSASIVEIEDTALDSATTTPIHSRGSSGDSTLHVCICQPDPKIPRPRNAFILYRQHHQAQVVSQNPGLANPDISKIIGEQWQNQPIEIKNKWKGLAEEEKLRHQQQYPTYRYQPKRNCRRGSLSSDANASGEKPKCAKCGGRSTLIPSTPSGISPASVPPTPGSANTPVSRTLPGLNNLSLQSPAVRRMGRAFHYSNMSPVHGAHGEERDDVGPLSPDMKRRKYNGDYGTPISRTMPQRYAVAPPGVQVGPGTPFPFALPAQSPHPYPPAVMQARRESLPGLRGVVSPPGPMPPPPRPGMGYQQHRVSQGHIHHDRSLQLPPLQTGSVSGPSGAEAMSASGKTVDEQIMAMPFRYKVKVLSQVAPPAPMDAVPRGPLIAIEGDSADAVADLGKWLFEELKKSTDLAVTQFDSPDLAADGGEKKTTKKPMVQYHLLASEWLAKSDEIIEAISYKPVAVPATVPVDSAMTNTSPKEPASSHRNIDENYDDTDSSPAKPTSPPLPKPQPPASNMDLDTPPTPTPTTTTPNTTTTTLPIATANTPKPVGLIADYSLRASNVFACRIPIGPHDPYSPSDHWQWTATQWRGVVGPDLTVSVRDAGAGEGKATVEIMEEGGLIVIKRSVVGGGGDGEGSGSGSGTVDASVLRRLGFEVGEWVRAFGGVKGGST